MEELLGGGYESLGVYLLVMPGLEGAVQRAEQLRRGKLWVVYLERARRVTVHDQPPEAADDVVACLLAE